MSIPDWPAVCPLASLWCEAGLESPASRTGYWMFNLDTGKLKRSGRVTHLLEPGSASQFDTPAGRLDGHHIEIQSHHGDEISQSASFNAWPNLSLKRRSDLRFSNVQVVIKLGVFTATKTAGAALLTK
jgi:hypothetical protein